MRLLLLVLAIASLAACGNNRMRGEWDNARDTLNKPFK